VFTWNMPTVKVRIFMIAIADPSGRRGQADASVAGVVRTSTSPTTTTSTTTIGA
jgi:hypothetical protein